MALRMLAPDWAEKKSFVLFCPIGVQLLHSRFHVFLHSVCFICHNLILIYTSREIISDVSEKRFRPYDFCPVYFVLPRLTAPGSPRMCTSWPANVKLKGDQNAIWRHADHDDYFRMEKLTIFTSQVALWQTDGFRQCHESTGNLPLPLGLHWMCICIYTF